MDDLDTAQMFHKFSLQYLTRSNTSKFGTKQFSVVLIWNDLDEFKGTPMSGSLRSAACWGWCRQAVFYWKWRSCSLRSLGASSLEVTLNAHRWSASRERPQRWRELPWSVAEPEMNVIFPSRSTRECDTEAMRKYVYSLGPFFGGIACMDPL